MINVRPRQLYALTVATLVYLSVCPKESACAKDESKLTLGAYQVYKTPDVLWLVINVDRIVGPGSYTANRLVCVRVFRIDSQGTVHGWAIPNEPEFSANDNFSYLAAVNGDMFLMSRLSLHGLKLTDAGKPLRSRRR